MQQKKYKTKFWCICQNEMQLCYFKQWKSKMDKASNLFIGSLIKKIRSGVIHIEFLNGEDVIASGSGFLSNDYLITNNHVYMGHPIPL